MLIGYEILKNIVIGHLNVNSLKKIEAVEELILKNDICLLSEIKINKIFPNQKFYISNYKRLRRYRTKHGEGYYSVLMKTFHCKLINDEDIPNDIEMILFEFLVNTRKGLCIGIYKPLFQNKNYIPDIISKILSKLICQYANWKV